MDVAIALDVLLPGAKYSGSVTSNDQAAFDLITWHDERPKPTWAELLHAPVNEVTTTEVDSERDKRISAGFDFNGVTFQSRLPTGARSGDWEVFSGKALEALIAVIGGAQPGDLRWSDPAEDFAWIAADNSRVAMDAQTVIALGKAASAHRSAHTFAGSDLKARNPIPADYADDKWWP